MRGGREYLESCIKNAKKGDEDYIKLLGEEKFLEHKRRESLRAFSVRSGDQVSTMTLADYLEEQNQSRSGFDIIAYDPLVNITRSYFPTDRLFELLKSKEIYYKEWVVKRLAEVTDAEVDSLPGGIIYNQSFFIVASRGSIR